MLQTAPRDAIDFSTNDYLSMSRNPEVLRAAFDAGMKYGCGATGSRLLSGNNELFEEFEKIIAKDKNTESAMIFSSGYQANLTVLSALCDSKVFDKKQIVLFFDKLNHASLYNAALLTKAKLERYPHKNLEILEDLLKKHTSSNFAKIIVSETVFGMDGDIADLDGLIFLSKKYNAMLYLDEAHATGVIGKRGYGLSTQYDIGCIDCVIMGTFSKALGVSGAYIACSEDIKNYLIQKCSGFIYSTAPSPLVIGAAKKSWELVGTMDKERRELMALSDYFRKKLLEDECGGQVFDTMSSVTNIIPIKMQSSMSAINARDQLYKKNIIVSAVRQPTVSIPRIRISITSSISKENVDYLFRNMETLQRK
jgi:8-amino-7-oxononanoate synthase